MERELAIRTPESITILYELAGLGSRFLAVFLDLLVQLVAGLLIYGGFALLTYRAVGGRRVTDFAEHTGQSVVTAIITAATFLLFFGYFIVAEWRFNGRTVGKRIIGIRVVRDGGYPLDFLASAIRNLVRILEAGLGFYAVSAIVTLFSRENKRLGDYAAGTIVVRDVAIAPSLPFTNTIPATPILDAAELARVDLYIDRRAQLSRSARARVAARIAEPLRARIVNDSSLTALDDDALIVRLGQSRGGT